MTAASDTSIAALLADESRADRSTVTIAGLVTSVAVKVSKKSGNPWAAVTVEDLEGSIEVLFFGETYLAYSTMLAEDAVVVLKGRVSRRDEAMSLQALEMTLPDLASASDTAPITVQLAESRCTEPLVIKLREVLESHPGTTEVHLKLTMPGRATVMRLEDRLRVERSSALYGDLKALLGPNCLGT